MKYKYNIKGIETNYGIISNLESKFDDIQEEVSEDNAQYNISFQTEGTPERNYDNSEIKLEYIASLDYFPHNMPENTVVKVESMYNLHIINGLNIGYQILGFREIAQDTGCNVVNSSEHAMGSGQTKMISEHERRHNEIHDEYQNRCQDKANQLV